MNMQLTLARAAADEADRQWREHRDGCPPCQRAQRRRHVEEMCGRGGILYADRKAAADALKAERELAKQPIPGQGTLISDAELEPFIIRRGRR